MITPGMIIMAIGGGILLGYCIGFTVTRSVRRRIFEDRQRLREANWRAGDRRR